MDHGHRHRQGDPGEYHLYRRIRDGEPRRQWFHYLPRLNGLYIVPAQKPLGATDQAVSITLSRSEMKLLPGCTTELTAEVMPWGLEDKSVTWFSSNESVAQVKDGVVTALAEGSATIRAVTNAEPHLEAVCTVTVAEAEDIHFSALVRGETGSQWTEFSTGDLSTASSFGSGRTIWAAPPWAIPCTITTAPVSTP